MKMDENHWDNVYRNKNENEVSWYQNVPTRSLELITELKLSPDDEIIDIGGGDSHLVDHLLAKGFEHLTILDISSAALDRVKERISKHSNSVKFISSDITKFDPQETYKLWHDRATFHFLTSTENVTSYLEIANRAIAPGGYLIVSTFSKTGPEKCSGLPIAQYSEGDLKALFQKFFNNIRCLEDIHRTPWGSNQNFVYCGFKKRT